MEQFPLRWFRSSVCPNHNNPQTKPDCRPYRQSRVECRFGRSGSSGFVDGGAVSLTGFEDEGRLAVEADVKKLFKFF